MVRISKAGGDGPTAICTQSAPAHYVQTILQGTCEDVVRPRLEAVGTTNRIEYHLSRLETSRECQPPLVLCLTSLSELAGWSIQMVGIIQAELATLLLELLRGKTFKGSLGGNRHEDGERNGAMREDEVRGAGFCNLCAV